MLYTEATERAAPLRRGHRHPGRRHPGRQGRAACGTTRRPSAGSAPPARRSPTRWPATPTSCSASAPATATSPPRRAPPSRTRTCGSSTSTSPRSTRPSMSAVAAGRRRPRGPGGADRGASTATASTTPYVQGYTEHKDRLERRRRRGLPPRPPAAARPRPRSSARSTSSSARDAVVVQAAGSMPGDLQMLWRAQDPKQYHVEYALLLHGLRDRRRARASRWPPRSARCSPWSATAPT